jgi:hypothetical protein
MIEGSGSIPLNNGSGSGSRRPKNIQILLREDVAQAPVVQISPDVAQAPVV